MTTDARHDAMLAAVLAVPRDVGARGILADWLDDQERHPEAALLRAGNVLLDYVTATAIRLLCACRFTTGSWDKRFCLYMHDRISSGTTQTLKTISVKQMAKIWRLVKKYRRQLQRFPGVVSRAMELGF